jgi:enoyl-CoA hydratase
MQDWASSNGLVTMATKDGVATVRLDNPAKRNCVSAGMSGAVAEACAHVNATQDVRAVILTGAGTTFSAGGDIEALANPGYPLEPLYAGFKALGTVVVPVVAAVNGAAVGAGINFALACDLIVAAQSATFRHSFLDLAIHPGGAHLWRMNGLVGRQATAAAVLFGEDLTADQARDIGLVWKVVEDDQLLTEANRLAGIVAKRSPEVVRRTKATLQASIPITSERIATDLEQVQQEWSMARPEYREATKKLLERIGK